MAETITANPLLEPLETDLTEADILEARRLFVEFLQLPQQYLDTIYYIDESQPRNTEAGYKFKSAKINAEEQGSGDRKHIFHYSQDLETYLAETQAMNGAPEAAQKYIELCRDLYYSASRSIRTKVEEWDGESPVMVSTMWPDSGKLKHHLRHAAYLERDSGNAASNVLATNHYDMSMLTGLLDETKRGLHVGLGDHDQQLVEAEFNPRMFTSLGWNQLHEMLGLPTAKKAVVHGVDNIDPEVTTGHTDANGLEIVRMALIEFVNPANIYLDSKLNQTHTPIEWEEGADLAVPKESLLV